MARKAKGPEQFRATEDTYTTKAMPSDLLDTAMDRRKTGRAYGHASAWLRDNKTPPPKLCAWLSERLAAVAAVLMDDREKKRADAVLRALGAAGTKRGNKAKMNDDRDSFLAWDVLYARQTMQTKQTFKETFAIVAARCSLGKNQVSDSVVEAAWKRRREFGIRYRK